MKDLLLIDGNSMLFRAYYATLYTRMMRTRNGIPTNAVYGFILMIRKAFELLAPDGVLVAWDTGKPTFRHKEYDAYKGTRKEIDQDLILQFPIVREFLDSANIKRYECEGIEADDIIGSLAKKYPDLKVHILSSDKDLLQLIDDTSDVFLMKKGISEMQIVNEAKLKEMYGLKPHQIIDLKALMGDASDNIPGVKGIGEKTALKLLETYKSVDNVYEHIDELKGKLKEKLEIDKDNAFLSKYLATIKLDAIIDIDLSEMLFNIDYKACDEFFKKYEMDSLIQSKIQKDSQSNKNKIEGKVVKTISTSLLNKDSLIYPCFDQENYYEATLYGFSLANDTHCEFITLQDTLLDQGLLKHLKKENILVFDAKMMFHMCYANQIDVSDTIQDVLIMAYLLNGNVHDDGTLANAYQLHQELRKDEVFGKKGKSKLVDIKEVANFALQEASNYASIVKQLTSEIETNQMKELLNNIEMPCVRILYLMELQGIHVDREKLNSIAVQTSRKIDEITQEIYHFAHKEFNVNSTKQLASVLYDDLGLKAGKKRSTAADILEKLKHEHPVIPLLLEHRKYQKIYSTYAIGLSKHILEDGKIHTIFNQMQTQTGRLSSSAPNLQNISIRNEEGKEIRKAFIASDKHQLLSIDYSQIELRLLAHMADEKVMIEAFCKGEDIHLKTAMKIFNVAQDDVDEAMRRSAKTVNFGIVYGQSDFGLSEQLHISRHEAHVFIEKYFNSYPKIKNFMEETIAYCEAHGYVKTIYQRRRYIPEINDKNHMMKEFGKRAAMNAPIQGSAADIMKMAMVNIFNAMQAKDLRSKMILQIHDELIFDVFDDELELMQALVEEGMQNVAKLKVPLQANACVGKSWYEAK